MLPERLDELDQLSPARYFLTKLFVDGRRAFNERVFIHFVGLHGWGEFAHQFFVQTLALSAGKVPHLPSDLRERVLDVFWQLRPGLFSHDKVVGSVDVTCQRQKFLYFLKFRGGNLWERIFLRVHDTRLKRGIDLGEWHGLRIRPVLLKHLYPPDSAGHS